MAQGKAHSNPFLIAALGASAGGLEAFELSAGQPEVEERILPKQLEHVILQRYAPACVIVRENGDAVYFCGKTSRYFEQPTGGPDANVVNMARESLRIALRTCLHRAVTAHERAAQKQVAVPTNGGMSHVDITVEPLAELGDANLFMIVIEEEAPPAGPQQPPGPASAASSEETVRRLESELRSAQEHAQTAFEELETSNEELKSANEELETVNTELNRKIAELDRTNSDFQNLLSSTQIATIFLDSNLHIKSFTPAAGSGFRLIAGDIGRPIIDLASQFAEAGLEEDIKEVLKTLSMRERDLTGAQGRHYLMRILPYRTVHNLIDGVVITFVDVTQLKQAEQLVEDARIYAQNIVDTVREPLVVLDTGLRVTSANRSFYKMFQSTAEETVRRAFYELGNRQWDLPELRRLLSELKPAEPLEDFQVEHPFADMGRKTMLLNARLIQPQNGNKPLILLAIEDITERKQSDNLLRTLNVDLTQFAHAASHDLQEPLRMVVSYTQLLARDYKGNLDERADQYIAYAVEGAQRMETLLRDLREYWSVNEQKVYQPVPIDCNRTLDKALDFLDLAIRESGGLVTHDRLPTVVAEEVPLVLLFQNLIGNALKYRRSDEPARIHVSAQRSAGAWSFSVRDNGIGIEAEHLEKIFAPFKRLHGSEYPGSGIGLAICQKLVERYGGRIWAESEYGQRSTFHFTIPA